MNTPADVQKGFTLIEMALALAVFAMLSLLAFLILSQANSQHQRTREEIQRFNQLQRGMALLDNDLLQLVARRNRSTGRIIVTGRDVVFSTQTRDPLAPLSDTLLLQTVHWYVRDHILYRAIRSSIDGDSDLPAQPIIRQVDQFHLDAETQTAGELPTRLRLHLVHQTYGSLQRTFSLPPLPVIEEDPGGDRVPTTATGRVR